MKILVTLLEINVFIILIFFFTVAERVYHKFDQPKGIYLDNKKLDIELELPWLNEHHDRHRVRVSGLTEELDPEKLRFYLSALSNNSVTQMSFNEDYTKAVADFHRPMSDAGKQYSFLYDSIFDVVQFKATLY